METVLKRVGSIFNRIQVFTLLAKENVRSAVALDAGLTANILQILQMSDLLSYPSKWYSKEYLGFFRFL